MGLSDSLDRIVQAEMVELEAEGVFNLIDVHEWYVDRYRELYDEAMADMADDLAENEWYWYEIQIESGVDNTEELKLMYQEYCDSYAANEWGDEMWAAGIDPWSEEMELIAEDMDRDAAIEHAAMCDAAAREEAYWDEVRRKELEALQEKLDHMD